MTRTLLALTLALGTLTPALALAQDPGTTTEYTFTDGDLVNGTLQSPMVDVIASRRLGRRHSLIQPRQHYTPEMLRSVENL